MTANRPLHQDAVSVLAPRPGRRSFLSASGLVGLSALLAACGGGSGAGSTDGKIEDALNVYTWGEYDDPKVLKKFTATEGPKITLDNYGSNEEMIAKLVAAKGTSGYDVVVPSGYYVPQMAQNGLLMELDPSLMPNLAKVGKDFKDQPFDPGNKYTVVKAAGTTGYAYDSTVITRELKTWPDFFDAAQKEGSGRTSLLEDPGEITSAYFNANGIDENTVTTADYDAAQTFLVDSIAPHVQAFDSNAGSGAIPTNEHALVQSWNGDARLGMLNNPEPDRWRWVLPTPTNRWQDNWAIPTGAPHPVAAHALINYVMDPAVAFAELDYIGYDTAVDGVQARAEQAGTKRMDMIFFTPEQTAGMTVGAITKLTPRQTEIVNAMRARAGS